MYSDTLDLTLDVVPRARFDMLDLRARLRADERSALAPYPRCLCWSSHTTAGFLDASIAARLGPNEGIAAYVDAFRTIFPEGADYEHDRLDRRTELNPEQRRVEPRNADSHLAFIAAGMKTCVTYANRPAQPLCFVDLDGVCAGRSRRRRARIIGYHREEEVARTSFEVPVSSHLVDSINLKDPRLGIYEQVAALVARYGVAKGRVRLSLNESEHHAGLTVNEYETLLMQHDLPEVLRDPLRFAVEKARHAIADPRAVPAKTLGYAKYDLVHVVNMLVDRLGLRESLVDRLLSRTLAMPAARFLRMKRSVSLLVSDHQGTGQAGVVEGTYQSTILVQWHRAPRATRRIDAMLTRFA
ncbi:MAG: hypothetical protein ACM3NQ_01215 [Bacteroidales bacterium]